MLQVEEAAVEEAEVVADVEGGAVVVVSIPFRTRLADWLEATRCAPSQPTKPHVSYSNSHKAGC